MLLATHDRPCATSGKSERVAPPLLTYQESRDATDPYSLVWFTPHVQFYHDT